jgi:hypothetical protein
LKDFKSRTWLVVNAEFLKVGVVKSLVIKNILNFIVLDFLLFLSGLKLEFFISTKFVEF